MTRTPSLPIAKLTPCSIPLLISALPLIRIGSTVAKRTGGQDNRTLTISRQKICQGPTCCHPVAFICFLGWRNGKTISRSPSRRSARIRWPCEISSVTHLRTAKALRMTSDLEVALRFSWSASSS
jgi:hypothetical protein